MITPRQAEILQLVADGHDWKRIAGEIGVCYQTTRVHFANVRRRLGARNRAHAVAIAIRQGLIR